MSQMAAFVGAAVGATLRSARSAAISGRSLSVSAPAATRVTAPVRVRVMFFFSWVFVDPDLRPLPLRPRWGVEKLAVPRENLMGSSWYAWACVPVAKGACPT